MPEFGGLEVTTSSTALQALTDAVLYLVAYPFECAEQLSSRVLAVAALRDVLTAFQAEGLPKPDEIEAAVKRDIDRLRALQNDDGGFGFWRRGERPGPTSPSTWPTPSPARRRRASPCPTRPSSARGATCARSSGTSRPGTGRTCATRSRPTRSPCAGLLGDPDPGASARASSARPASRACRSRRSAGSCPTSRRTRGRRPRWRPSVAALANNVAETAGAAHFVVSYGDGAHLLLHSDRRADAILLEALIADQPRSDLVPKLVEGLLAHRKAGRWANTQENVFVLLALDRYFQAYEKTTPDFVARAWLGERYAGYHAFRGRTTERQPPRDPDALPPGRDGHERPPAREGGPGAALLPDRPALRAGRASSSSRSTTASPSSAPTRASTTRRT